MLNGVQFGVMLFLLAAGLTLIFGIMGVINLAHGSLYMIGAYAAASRSAKTGSFLLAIPAALAAAAAAGHAHGVPGHAQALCARPSRPGAGDLRADPVLQPGVTMLFGRQPLFVAMPPRLVRLGRALPGVLYPVYRLLIIAVGLLVALGLYR